MHCGIQDPKSRSCSREFVGNGFGKRMRKVLKWIGRPSSHVPSNQLLCQSKTENTISQCLEITKKVSFNIASKASYVYSDQKLINNAKWSILASFWNTEVCRQIMLPDRSVLKGQKLMGNAKNSYWWCWWSPTSSRSWSDPCVMRFSSLTLFHPTSILISRIPSPKGATRGLLA